MVTIQRGNETLTVTRGAYKTIFAPQGWEEVTTSEIITKEDDFKVKTENKEIIQSPPEKENLPKEDDENEDEIDLSEIPLSEMSVPQLKMYAKQLGVEVNTDSAKALRSQIRKVLEG